MDLETRRRLDADLAAFADGDRAAFDPVYSVAWPAVRSFVLGLLGGDSEAEDVAQQALLKVFERASEYDPERPALPWLLGIAAWETRSLRRRRSRSRIELGGDALLEAACDPSDGPARAAADAELRDHLEDLIGTLRPVDIEALHVALGRRPLGDLAPATQRKRMQRALARLRDAWRRRHDP